MYSAVHIDRTVSAKDRESKPALADERTHAKQIAQFVADGRYELRTTMTMN